MSDAARFAEALGIAPDTVAQALHRSRRALPWYAELVAAVGGWVAALLLTAAIAPFVIDDDRVVATGIFGLLLTIGGVAGHWKFAGSFGRQFTLALMLGGQTVLLVAVGNGSDTVTATAIAAVLIAVLLLPLVRDNAHQFLTVAAAVGLSLVALLFNEVPRAAEITALVTVPAGVALLLHPPRRVDMRAAAVVLLLTAPLCDAIGGMFNSAIDDTMPMLATAWGGRLAYVGGLLWPLLRLWPQAGPQARRVLAGVLAVAVAAALLLPAGLVAGLLVLVLAYTVGSRLLALLGVLIEVFFMTHFYYDLGLTLLAKSALLAVVGALLLGLWLLWRRAEAAP